MPRPPQQTTVLAAHSGLAAPFEPDLRGVSVGGYTIEKEIGRGAMGIVYRAVHPLLGSKAAVKVLHYELSTLSDFAERFLSEARAAAALRHPHIVQIYDLVALPDGRLCLVMEYLEGETLEQRAGQTPMPPARAKAILLQLCNALAVAHQRGIVHRDLKAQNILMVASGIEDYVKLLDFGLAKQAQESGLTLPGTVMGTPHYMAPEQIMGEPIDRRADIYALGVLAYRLLTGSVPFDGTPAEVLFHHVRTAPRELTNVPPMLRQVVMQALAKRREDRFSDTAQFARALRACPIDTPAPTPLPRVPPFLAHINGSVIALRFASEEAFRHVERHELSMGRLFVPGSPPTVPGLLTLVIDVPGRAVMEAPATLLGIYDRRSAEKHGIPEGFALTVRGRLSPRTGVVQIPSSEAVVHKPRMKRFLQRLSVTFGPKLDAMYAGTTTNVSARGIGVSSPYVVPVGAKLFVNVTLSSQETAHLQGVVVWSSITAQSAGGAASLGLRLTNVDERYQQFIVELAKAAAPVPLPSPRSDDDPDSMDTEKVWVR